MKKRVIFGILTKQLIPMIDKKEYNPLRYQHSELQKLNTDSMGTNIPVEVIAVGDKVLLAVELFAKGFA